MRPWKLTINDCDLGAEKNMKSKSWCWLWLSLFAGFSIVAGFLPGWKCVRGCGCNREAANLDRSRVSALEARTSRSSSIDDSSSSPWKQRPGETEFAYLKRLQQMASSAEEVVISRNTTVSVTTTTRDGKGYVRAEVWDAQVYKKSNMTWEERVQFDGQRHGDRFMQNEILRKNLWGM